MLRKNLCVKKGLVNGALGTVKDIVYHLPGQGPPTMPAFIMIQFDNFHGPFISDHLFPLQPTTANWKDNCIDCSRKQFPINLAYALTIHKAQGLTLNKAIIDMGERELAPGLTYVALSRVRRIEDQLLARAFDFSRLAGIRQIRQVAQRESFLREMDPDVHQWCSHSWNFKLHQ